MSPANSKKIRLAINGFGRIGRAAFKVAVENPHIDIVAINDLVPKESLIYLLKYDTAYGPYPHEVTATKDGFKIDKEEVQSFSIPELEKLPWKDLDIDVVIECTGVFTEYDKAKLHVEKAGAKHVIISAATKDEEINTFVQGVNADDFDASKDIVSSLASCTTNCITPVTEIIHRELGIAKSYMTTIHAYTSTQALVDGPHKKDPRRGRAAAANIIPTSTSAAIATTKVIKELEGMFQGVALRVPVITGSISDMTFIVKKKTTKEKVNKILKMNANSPRYKGILGYSEDPLVSSDIIGRSESSIVDSTLTDVVQDDLVKVYSWYDNEWGYSNRLIDQAVQIGTGKPANGNGIDYQNTLVKK
ncbi:type I glyceraldehyde-3-phosphate dehydrogenase [Patescibacteria group bacterium]